MEAHTTQTEFFNCNEVQVSALTSNRFPEFLELIQDFTGETKYHDSSGCCSG